MLKNLRKITFRTLGFMSLFLLSFLYSAAWLATPCTAFELQAENPQVDSSLLFHQAKITFTGKVDEGCDVIVKIIGSDKKVIFGKNGLYPSNYFIVDNLPSHYKVLFSGSMSGVSPEIRNDLNLQSDFGFLKNNAVVYSRSEENKVISTGPDADKKVNKAISSNEMKGNYRYIENSIEVDQNGKFKGTVNIGSDEYSPSMELQVYAVRNNIIVDRRAETVSIPYSLIARTIDVENDPILYAGIFLCFTVFIATAADELLGNRGGKTVYH